MQQDGLRLFFQGHVAIEDDLVVGAQNDVRLFGLADVVELDREIHQGFVAQKNALHSRFGEREVGQHRGGGLWQINLHVAQEWGRIDVFVPLIFLVVAEQDDVFAGAERISQQRIGQPEGSQIGAALEGGLEVFEFLPGRLAVFAEGRHDARRGGQLHDRHLNVSARFAGFAQDTVAVASEAVVGLVAEGVVEDIDAAFLDWDRIGAAQIRPRKGRDQQEQRKDAQGKQKQIAQTPRTLARMRQIVQEAQRGKLYEVCFFPPAQVQPHGRGKRERAEQEPGVQEREGHGVVTWVAWLHPYIVTWLHCCVIK